MLINGKQTNLLDANDRGLNYADGVFETVRISSHQPVLWPLHKKRLQAACQSLCLPLQIDQLENELIPLLQASPAQGVLKIIVTRGIGGRGYKAPAVIKPSRIIQFHEFPSSFVGKSLSGVNVMLCETPLSVNSRLAGIKHLGRLDQVLASAELTDGYDEGIMFTDAGVLIEGTRSNLFLVVDGQLTTPDLKLAGIRGVMREYLLQRFSDAGSPVQVAELQRAALERCSEMFICNSVFGVWPVVELQLRDRVRSLSAGAQTITALKYQAELFNDD